MALPRGYITGGTVSVANGADSFMGSGTLFGATDLEGATLIVFPSGSPAAEPILVGVVAAIDPRYPEETYPNTGPISLTHTWGGASIVDEPYILILGPAIVASSTVSAILARFIAYLEDNAGLVHNSADDLDYDIVRNNSLVINPTTRTISQWRSGTLELVYSIGLPFAPKGPWVGAPISKFELTPAGSPPVVTPDWDDGIEDANGVRHFQITLSEAIHLNPIDNIPDEGVAHILFVNDAGVAITADSVYGGIEDLVRTTAGARTRVAVTAVAEGSPAVMTDATSEIVTFSQNDVVDDGGSLFISNVDDNTQEPQFSGSPLEPISNEYWTVSPSSPGEDGATGAPGSSDVVGTSTSSVAIGTGSKGFTIVEDDRGWGVGARLRISSDATPQTNWMEGVVTAYSANSLTVLVDLIGGSGTLADWTINLAGEPGVQGEPGSTAIGVSFSQPSPTLANSDGTDLQEIVEDFDAAISGKEPADATILKDADIGVSVQAFDADTAKLDVMQTFSALQIFQTAITNNAPVLALLSEDGAVGGPRITAHRTSTSPAANDDIGQFSFVGKDSGGNDLAYGIIQATILDPTDGSEDGAYKFNARIAGALTEVLRVGATGVFAPAIGTTVSAANAFLDSGSSPANQLLRSTSSIRYKRDVEPLEKERADAIMALQPVWFRSKIETDPQDWSWYGLIAEDVANVDPRLVHYGYAEDAYDQVETELPPLPIMEQKEVRGKKVWTQRPGTKPEKHVEMRLKPDAVKVPDGVQYDRLVVLLLDIVKRQEQRIASLEAKMKGSSR